MAEVKKKLTSDLFKGLKENVLTQEPTTPTQQVSPTKESRMKDEAPFTLWIPEKRMKALKIKSLENGKSLKEMINEAIENYLGA